jgi:tRNA (guanine-N7-)-methyltransferase
MKQLLSKELPRLSLDKAALSSAPLASQFDSDKDALFLEIGFGGGEHLAQLAAGNPHAGFIGAEPFINGVASLVRQIDEHALSNIRIWSDDVRPLLMLWSGAVLMAFTLCFLTRGRNDGTLIVVFCLKKC